MKNVHSVDYICRVYKNDEQNQALNDMLVHMSVYIYDAGIQAAAGRNALVSYTRIINSYPNHMGYVSFSIS